jgi:hypothetical protein
VRQLVEDAVEMNHPFSVKQLARSVIVEHEIDEAKFIATIKDMVNDGSLVLEQPAYEIESPADYLFAPVLSAWLWATLGVTATGMLVVALTPETYPSIVVRWILGAVLLFYMPGHALLQFLFPTSLEMDLLERFILGIGASLAIAPTIGLLLTYTPSGISFIATIASLGLFTMLCSVGAALRRYLSLRKRRLSVIVGGT